MANTQVDQALLIRAAASDGADATNGGQRRSGADRRVESDRRRRGRGLLERRALQEGFVKDRRQRNRRKQIVARVWEFFSPARSLISR